MVRFQNEFKFYYQVQSPLFILKSGLIITHLMWSVHFSNDLWKHKYKAHSHLEAIYFQDKFALCKIIWHSTSSFALFTRLYKWLHSFRFIQESIAITFITYKAWHLFSLIQIEYCIIPWYTKVLVFQSLWFLAYQYQLNKKPSSFSIGITLPNNKLTFFAS